MRRALLLAGLLFVVLLFVLALAAILGGDPRDVFVYEGFN